MGRLRRQRRKVDTGVRQVSSDEAPCDGRSRRHTRQPGEEVQKGRSGGFRGRMRRSDQDGRIGRREWERRLRPGNCRRALFGFRHMVARTLGDGGIPKGGDRCVSQGSGGHRPGRRPGCEKWWVSPIHHLLCLSKGERGDVGAHHRSARFEAGPKWRARWTS